MVNTNVNTNVDRNILIPPTGQTNEPPAPVVAPGTNVQWPRPDSLI